MNNKGLEAFIEKIDSIGGAIVAIENGFIEKVYRVKN